MLNNTYDGRRPLFWIVTLMAATVVVHIVLAFWRSRFAHPVSAVADLMVASAIWLFYFSIVRRNTGFTKRNSGHARQEH